MDASYSAARRLIFADGRLFAAAAIEMDRPYGQMTEIFSK